MSGKRYRCMCGQWSGERCECIQGIDEMNVVEFMPKHLRESHEKAGNRGVYPQNGAVRIAVSEVCAENMMESDPEWTGVIFGVDVEDFVDEEEDEGEERDIATERYINPSAIKNVLNEFSEVF